MLTCCGENVIMDIINEEEVAYCPHCGKDFTYELLCQYDHNESSNDNPYTTIPPPTT